MKAVFLATMWEAKDALLENEYGFAEILSSPFGVWRNSDRYVFVSGIGLVNASACFAWAVRNYDFDSALNVGMAGKTMEAKISADSDAEAEFGGIYEISKVVCIEPYNELVFTLPVSDGTSGRSLVTSSRSVESIADRRAAGRIGELVDMEGYAFARAADIFGKELRMSKLVSDFSPECDIYKNTIALRHKLATRKDFWQG